jgi:murein DD-endopeptidase MepM/ murein hydrolase activator NlpD
LQVKSKYLSILSNRDIRLIDDLSLATDVLAGLQQEQAEQLASLNQKSEALAATEIALAAREADLKQIISELESSRAGQLAVRTSLLKEQEAIEANIGRASASLASEQARLQREAEEKRRQAAAASSETQRQALTQDAQRLEARLAALGAPLPPLSGSYSYPFANPTLVSRFGEDQATFVALRADAAGAAVHAMQSGVVISVQNMGANFGHMVMVKHSEDVTLAYLNLQDSLLVESGQSLSQGDILGYLGGSTLTPQNVLKLYAYRNDSFVDPLKVIGF